MGKKVTIFWFRRDLRLDDNVGFSEALKGKFPVLPIFIFDKEILDRLPKKDPRVTFIFDTLQKVNKKILEFTNNHILLYYSTPKYLFKQLLKDYEIQGVYTNHDYEPYAKERDIEIETLLKQHKRSSDGKPIRLQTFKDQVIFEKDEIVKKDGSPYVVYTPYKRVWMSCFKEHVLKPYDTKPYLTNIAPQHQKNNISLQSMGFERATISIPEPIVTSELIQEYEATRNFPAKDTTSRLGPHLRFGTVSIRAIVKKAIAEVNEVFLSELIWREFFMQILWHFPHTASKSFRPKYDRIEWRNDEQEFDQWKNGQTGYPLVDAGIRELNTTGFMHNRVRMLVASFLCKHLLIDWRWGEAYFAEKLLDYEMASNVGNWQWAAGSGVDAAPYFRIFNPSAQVKKFDKQHEYIKKWVPDINELTYPQPIVDHKIARERCLQVYKTAVR